MEVIKDNMTLILICGFMFLTGIGIGAAINEVIRKEKDDGQTMD